MHRGWLKPKELRFQHVSESSKADIRVSQFRWQIVPDSRSGNRKVSVAKTVLCPRNDACSVVDWSKKTPSAVSEKLNIIRQALLFDFYATVSFRSRISCLKLQYALLINCHGRWDYAKQSRVCRFTPMQNMCPRYVGQKPAYFHRHLYRAAWNADTV